MSDESNVTFVGGKAIEQHEAAESNLPSDERAEAMKAVKEAIAGAAKEATESADKASKQDPYKPEGAKAERDPETGKFLPKGGKTQEKAKSEEVDDDDEPIDTTSAPLKQLLKAREKLAKQKVAQKDEFAQERAKIQEETRKIQQTWAEIQQMQRQIQQQTAYLQKLKSDPATAVREFGWEPEEFIVNLAKEGTPEGAASRAQREIQAQLAEIRKWKEEMSVQEQQRAHQAQFNQQVQFRDHIEKTFIGGAMNEEKNPHIASFYKGRESALIAQGDLIAAEFRELSGGREASLEEIIDYIEEDLADRATAWYEKKSGTKKDGVLQASGNKPAKGSKGKSLNPELSGERRALGKKSLKDLDEEERLLAAKESVGMALAAAANR